MHVCSVSESTSHIMGEARTSGARIFTAIQGTNARGFAHTDPTTTDISVFLDRCVATEGFAFACV